MRLNRLEIEGLRGIPRGWPSIAIGESGLVVYGPNGSGKSSIIDGIEAALHKESSLYPERRQGVNWEKGGEHVKGGPRHAELFGTDSGSQFSLNDDIKLPAVTAWKEGSSKSIFVLRRHMLLRFIMSQAADRYDSLEPFFNLQEFEKLEAALNGLLSSARTVERGLEATEARQSLTLRVRLDLPDGAALTQDVARAHLLRKLQAAGIDAGESAESLEQAKRQVSSELAGISADSRFTMLTRLRAQVEELAPSSTYDDVLRHLEELHIAYSKARDESPSVAPAEFLHTAQELIEAQMLPDCPVCEQPIDPTQTIESLKRRIESDVKATSAHSALIENLAAVRRTIEAHANAFNNVVNGCSKAFGDGLSSSYVDEARLLSQIQRILTDSLLDQLPDVRAALKSTIANHQSLLERISAELADSGASRRTVLSDVVDAFRIVEADVSALTSTQALLKLARNQTEALERLAGHTLRARRATVQKIVDRIASLANEFYEYVHPGEGIAHSALDIRDVGKGSIELTTMFHGSVEHPLLHFSESHLDTLGLCYFLAARRLEADSNPDFKLLVLDDVVHSVDADHRDRIARLLKARFADHQIVIVTHDSIFYQRLRAIFGSKFEYVYFTNWSLEDGPVRIQGSTDIDRITDATLRGSMSQDELASACGRFSEWLCMQLDERLQVAVQARFTRPHDLGSLWPPLASKLKKLKGFESNSEIVERIDASQWVRNKVGAHYNEPECPVTPAEVRTLAKALSDLYEVTFCPECGSSIAKVDDKKSQCDCTQISYAPLVPAGQAP